MAGVYESDPRAAPDGDFAAGELAHLVAGNRGRLLDARRTPVAVLGVEAGTGMFAVEVRGFEDAGARWELPVEDVGRFQFARDSRRAPDGVVAALAEAARRFDRPGDVACDPGAREATLRRLRAERGLARLAFVSATFSREAAEAHFAGGPATRVAVLWRQALPLRRLFMTFLETEAMNRAFREAEAVLLGDPDNRAF